MMRAQQGYPKTDVLTFHILYHSAGLSHLEKMAAKTFFYKYLAYKVSNCSTGKNVEIQIILR